VALRRISTAAALAADALWARQALLVLGHQGHGLDQRLDLEGVFRVVRIGEAQGVAQLRDAVLHLDAGVHLHEVVPPVLDDALEGRGRVQPHGAAEAFGLVLHLGQHGASGLEHLGLAGIAVALRRGDGLAELLLRDRDLDQLLLVHLEGAVAAAEGDGPLAVAENLDLVVARGLDVELDEQILVVADAGGFDLAQDFAHQAGNFGGRREDALALAAAAADRLEAKAAPGILAEELNGLALHLLGELLDGVEVEALGVGRLEDLFRQILERELGILAVGDVQAVRLGELDERSSIGVFAEKGARRDVVDAGGDGDMVLDGGAFGLVLGAGGALRVRAGADEDEPGFLEQADELGILGHEAVAGEDVAIAVAPADLDHLLDALEALVLGGAAVVGHRVHVFGVHHAQLGRERARG